MLRRRRPPEAPDPTPPLGNQFGWRVHDAVQAWTASVDQKASIVVIAETAVAGAGTRALISKGGELHHATGLHLATAIAAVAVLVLAVACALWVIFPRLARKRTARLAADGLIYFGHLSHRTTADIATALTALTPDEERHQLASQLHVTGQVAWRKHAWLQASLLLFALGASLLVLSFTAF